MHARFHAPAALRAGDVLDLPAAEAQHLERVLRLRAGDSVRVFNGAGAEFEAVVEVAGRQRVQVRLVTAVPPAPEAAVAITLALAALKSDRMDAAIRDAVMLGAAAVQPFVARRSEVSLATLVGGGRRARWQKIAVASAKQCGRAVVPPVRDPVTFDGLMDSLDARGAGGPILLLAEPSAGAEVAAIGQIETTAPRSAVVVVGPEGGWAEEELARAAGRCRFVSLGGRTLRAETVPLVALTALLTRWSAL